MISDTGGDGTRGQAYLGSSYLERHADRLAWIMGSSRSGSTWLLRMLADLERVVGIDDPHLGHHLGVWRPLPLAWAAADTRPDLTTLLELKREKPDYFFSDAYRDAWLPALRELIRLRFGAQLVDHADLTSDPTLVVKEPGSHPAELLFEALPGSCLVFLLRDGRDVVDSWLDAYQSDSWAINEGAFAVSNSARLTLIEWLSSVWSLRTRAVSTAFAELPPERRVLVRYEDLLAHTEPSLRRISTMLGIEASDGELERIVKSHEFSRLSSRGPRREARRAQPGGWRLSMSAREREAMHSIMGADLAAFGYPVAPASDVA